MKISTWRSWMGAAAIGLATALPAHAALVTFDDVLPDITAFGGSLSSGGYNFTDDDFGGFVGIDSATAFDPAQGGAAAAPANPTGQFLYMLNGAGVFMTSQTGGAFFLNSFDAAFLSPVSNQAGVSPGQLSVALFNSAGNAFATEEFDLPSGTAGDDFPFATLFMSNRSEVYAAYFYSCSYQPNGDCEFFGQSPSAQFALDNISDAFRIPEPGSAALALTALGALFIRRRKASAA